MSETVLGLDIGSSSLGGGLIDLEKGTILDSFVRIFPEGVDRDQQGGEKSKSQTRRTARGARRQIQRRAERKENLRAALTAVGLLPEKQEELQQLWEQNPYELRRAALSEKLELRQLGRVFFHLAQRRGFLSNRKTDQKRDDTKGMLAEIGSLEADVEAAGATLGQFLAEKLAQLDHRDNDKNNRVRRRHTKRSMYINEFLAIWQAQREHYPDLLTEKLKFGRRGKQAFPKLPEALRDDRDLLSEYGIFGILFFQRKMYWPRSVVGRCELEPHLKRGPKANRSAQRFRILQEVNNLRLLDRTEKTERRLTDEERTTLIDYLADAKERTFEQIRKKLGLLDSARFNFERGERDKLKGHLSDALLSSAKALGKKRWKQLPERTKDAIVAILIEEDQEEDARCRLTTECKLSREEAEQALGAHLPEGYLNFSLLAIEKLIPFLERGLMLMGNDASDSALHAAGYLRPDEREVNQQQYLPPPPDMPNPIVRQALHEVRKLVNHVIRKYGKPVRIHVELAREAKKSFDQRREIRIENAKRRRERERVAKLIERLGHQPRRDTINKVLLWEEQQQICPYCGQPIGQSQLFNGEADVDHILPRWRSLDDSLANKVVCHILCNREKGDRTPREWLEGTDQERYETMLQAIKWLPYNKQRKFWQKEIELNDFINRQLNDTAYISRCVSQYLQCLGVDIVCPRGQMTSELRHRWGLNNILDPENRGRKNRFDHRHHAIDALVLAVTDYKRLHALANAREDELPPPWEKFRQDAERMILSIQVSHRALRQIAGALHEATFYGPTQKNDGQSGDDNAEDPKANRRWAKEWVEDKKTFVRRKSIGDLTNTKQLVKVRDKTIREILEKHLRDQGIDPSKPKKLPSGAFNEDDPPRMPSGVPIKKVRMLEESETFRSVSKRRSYQYVKPGNNHHIVYRAAGEGEKERWNAEVTPMWDAARRAKHRAPLVELGDNENGRFMMSLSIGEMFEIDGHDGEILLCVVRKLDQRSRRVYYKLHTDAREASAVNKDNLYLSPKQMQQRNATKVTVDPLGRIRRAND